MIWMMVIPILVVIFLFIYCYEVITWYEYLISPIASIIAIYALGSIADYVMSSDTEYHGGWVTQGVWKEHWTETYTETETYTDSDGKSQTRIVTKTRYHPDEYNVEDSNGYSVPISYDHFEQLCSKFGNRHVEKPWNIGQSSWGDGHLYTTKWNGNEATFTPCFTSHRYKNRVARSNSVFNFREISEIDKKNYGLYEYPEIFNYYHQKSILGWNDPSAEERLTLTNARLGASKQVRIFILAFHNQSLEAGILQQNLWKNGNKNEVVICMGVNTEGISWCYPFSWNNERLLVDLREEIMSVSSRNVDMKHIVSIVIPMVEKNFHRKHFKDFDYINLEPPVWAKMLCFIFIVAINMGIAFVVVNNEHK